jgi:hypothetical protein
MKKLLLLISSVAVLTIVSCTNTNSKTNDAKVIDTNKTVIDTPKVNINSTPVAQDIPQVGKQSEKPKTVGNEQGIKKDTVKPATKGTAIIHNVPNQEKIDSIRKTKQKIAK